MTLLKVMFGDTVKGDVWSSGLHDTAEHLQCSRCDRLPHLQVLQLQQEPTEIHGRQRSRCAMCRSELDNFKRTMQLEFCLQGNNHLKRRLKM